MQNVKWDGPPENVAGKVLVSAGGEWQNGGMGKGRQILLVVVLLAAAGGMAWILADKRPPEPVYNGKPLQYWLAGYDPSFTRTNSEVDWQAADEAVDKIGADAVPTLLWMLDRRDSGVKLKILLFLLRHHLIKTIPPAADLNWKATHAFATLGPRASNAVPRLIEMFKHDHSPFGQTASVGILGRIGPSAAAPLLLKRGICHTNAIVRNNSIYALRKIHPEPGLVIPEFIKCLSDPEPLVRGQAARALGDYGKDAQAAVPLLLKLYRSEPPRPITGGRGSVEGPIIAGAWTVLSISGLRVPDVKTLAADALKEIDPEAAEKAEEQLKSKNLK